MIRGRTKSPIFSQHKSMQQTASENHSAIKNVKVEPVAYMKCV